MDSVVVTYKTDFANLVEEEEEIIPPAPWTIKILFYLYKGINSFYCAFFFYFFPLYFTIIPVSELIRYTSNTTYSDK